ncbi:MAG: cation:proton antiporter, partial [Anaerolineae bacterium]|nr:cation:proton antiporter [Anaerolineae bacterium]
LKRFHDSLAWLMQILMFLTLGLLISPSRLAAAAGLGIAAALVLCFVARPLSVFITLARSQFDRREKALIGWVGLRGAVPIILALFPLIQGVPAAERIFDVVFFIVLVSVLLQGATVSLLGRWLGLQAPMPSAEQLNRARAEVLRRQLIVATIPPGGVVAGQQIVDLRLPSAVLLVQIVRDGETLVPNGSTVLEEGDTVLFVADPDQAARVKQKLETRRANPFFAN